MSEFILYNLNKYVVPVMIKYSNNEFKQVNILSHKSIKISLDQISDTIINLTSGIDKVLVLKES